MFLSFFWPEVGLNDNVPYSLTLRVHVLYQVSNNNMFKVFLTFKYMTVDYCTAFLALLFDEIEEGMNENLPRSRFVLIHLLLSSLVWFLYKVPFEIQVKEKVDRYRDWQSTQLLYFSTHLPSCLSSWIIEVPLFFFCSIASWILSWVMQGMFLFSLMSLTSIHVSSHQVSWILSSLLPN